MKWRWGMRLCLSLRIENSRTRQSFARSNEKRRCNLTSNKEQADGIEMKSDTKTATLDFASRAQQNRYGEPPRV